MRETMTRRLGLIVRNSGRLSSNEAGLVRRVPQSSGTVCRSWFRRWRLDAEDDHEPRPRSRMTYRRARYRSGALPGHRPVPVDESLGLVDDYLTRPRNLSQVC